MSDTRAAKNNSLSAIENNLNIIHRLSPTRMAFRFRPVFFLWVLVSTISHVMINNNLQ